MTTTSTTDVRELLFDLHAFLEWFEMHTQMEAQGGLTSGRQLGEAIRVRDDLLPRLKRFMEDTPLQRVGWEEALAAALASLFGRRCDCGKPSSEGTAAMCAPCADAREVWRRWYAAAGSPPLAALPPPAPSPREPEPACEDCEEDWSFECVVCGWTGCLEHAGEHTAEKCPGCSAPPRDPR